VYEGKKPKIDKPEIKNEPKMQETFKSIKASIKDSAVLI
jgi:hypothetical protein